MQHVDAIGERDLLIGLPEETGIIEAGAKHALIAVTDQSVGVAVGVKYGKEMRSQLSICILQGEIFLVVAHDGDQYFFRKTEIALVKAAEDG